MASESVARGAAYGRGAPASPYGSRLPAEGTAPPRAGAFRVIGPCPAPLKNRALHPAQLLDLGFKKHSVDSVHLLVRPFAQKCGAKMMIMEP
jgi:hypothetical protein